MMRALVVAAVVASAVPLGGCAAGSGAVGYDGWVVFDYCHPDHEDLRPTPGEQDCVDNLTADDIRAMDTPRSRGAIDAAQVDAADEERSIRGE
jgi:hypothetical protein